MPFSFSTTEKLHWKVFPSIVIIFWINDFKEIVLVPYFSSICTVDFCPGIQSWKKLVRLGRRFDLPPKPCVRIWDNFFQNARTFFCSLRLYNCNKFGIKTVVDLFSIRQGLAQSLIMSRVLQTSLCPDNPEKSLDKDIVNLVNIKMIVESGKIYEYLKMICLVLLSQGSCRMSANCGFDHTHTTQHRSAQEMINKWNFRQKIVATIIFP